MLPSIYIEDIFLRFYDLIDVGKLSVQYQDLSPLKTFQTKLMFGESLTSNQGAYLLKLLEKYKKLSILAGYNYSTELMSASWKTPFRVLDLSKRIYVEKNEKGKLEVCCKFPYQLKSEFDKEIEKYVLQNSKISSWDHEQKVRRLSLYDINLVSIYEFAIKHSFEIDETLMCALADIEEIWQNEDLIRPYSNLNVTSLQIKNYSQSSLEYFLAEKNDNLTDLLLLAKSMGFPYTGKCESFIEKIAASAYNTFWIKNNRDFFTIYNTLQGKVAIVLDRNSKTLDWLKSFVKDAEDCSVNRDDIKVCFRDNKQEETGLNEWIKLAGVGGKVESGRILIFEHKPAKWLFKDKVDVKIIVTNNLYPQTSQITKDWLDSHPCVIYLGDIKPSEQRGKKIVEL